MIGAKSIMIIKKKVNVYEYRRGYGWSSCSLVFGVLTNKS